MKIYKNIKFTKFKFFDFTKENFKNIKQKFNIAKRNEIILKIGKFFLPL